MVTRAKLVLNDSLLFTNCVIKKDQNSRLPTLVDDNR